MPWNLNVKCRVNKWYDCYLFFRNPFSATTNNTIYSQLCSSSDGLKGAWPLWTTREQAADGDMSGSTSAHVLLTDLIKMKHLPSSCLWITCRKHKCHSVTVQCRCAWLRSVPAAWLKEVHSHAATQHTHSLLCRRDPPTHSYTRLSCINNRL